jgi:hypothetical protein
MKTTSSPVQVGLGYIIGLLLQPVSLWIVMDQFSGRPLKQWGFAIFPFFAAYASILQVPRSVFLVPTFGVAQALTILPAALLTWLVGIREVARGLLQMGTLLALANVGVIVFVYIRYNSKIY